MSRLLQIGAWSIKDKEATVACRQLGLPTPGWALPGGWRGKTTMPMWLDSFTCSGKEARLQDCQTYGGGSLLWGGSDQPYVNNEDAAIQCNINNAARGFAPCPVPRPGGVRANLVAAAYAHLVCELTCTTASLAKAQLCCS